MPQIPSTISEQGVLAMMRPLFMLVIPLALLTGPPNAHTDGEPRAVLIQNTEGGSCAADANETPPIAQETDVWCWAASAQSVMAFHKMQVQQCEIVNKTYVGDATTPDDLPFCCVRPNRSDFKCQKNGWPHDVFDKFALAWNWWDGALPQDRLTNQLCSNGPFVYLIFYPGGGGHSFVVKHSERMNGQLYLWVHDHSYDLDQEGKRRPRAFKLISYDQFVNGQYGNSQFEHGWDYLEIHPPAL
jgi:hypothetical protein